MEMVEIQFHPRVVSRYPRRLVKSVTRADTLRLSGQREKNRSRTTEEARVIRRAGSETQESD